MAPMDSHPLFLPCCGAFVLQLAHPKVLQAVPAWFLIPAMFSVGFCRRTPAENSNVPRCAVAFARSAVEAPRPCLLEAHLFLGAPRNAHEAAAAREASWNQSRRATCFTFYMLQTCLQIKRRLRGKNPAAETLAVETCVLHFTDITCEAKALMKKTCC